MHNKFYKTLILVMVMTGICLSSYADKPLVLFDEGHAQKAGNADWVINGGFSNFATTFKKNGCEIKAIKKLTKESLANARIIVLPEPNSAYSQSEQDAIVDFVNNGGGLYAIADHNNSDRNNDGIDSIGVLNQFLPKLGLKVDEEYFTEDPVSGDYSDTEITADVSSVGSWGGTTISCIANSAKAHIKVSAKHGGGAYIATNIVGTKCGKVVAMGDSSPYDDGSGDPRDKLYNGYGNPNHDHVQLANNTIKWLLKKESSAPAARMVQTMKNLEAVEVELSTTPTEDKLDFANNTRKNLVYMLNKDKGLLPVFIANGQEKDIYKSLMKQIRQQENFSNLHK